ncbi:MAG: hypothetical protein ABI200_02225 [Gaiellales bacterium]
MTPRPAPRTWTNRVGIAARLLDAVLALPVQIESITTSQLLLPGGMNRCSTLVELHGAGHVGRGEDITYAAPTQELLPRVLERRTDLIGSWTIGSLAAHLDETGITIPGAELMDDKPGYHRWPIESAALDLALRQAGLDLAGLIDVPWEPLTVSLSMGLGEQPSVDIVRRWLDRDPSITFKIDTSMAWHPELVTELGSFGDAVATIDFKAMYRGDWIDNDYPPSLYAVVGHELPRALLEDARLDADSHDALDEHALGRLTWDYPITAPEDVPGLPGSTARFSDLLPYAINIKPSRFGSLERLLGTIALCDEHGIPCYSGGQFELGWGRTQVQAITSLCFPDAPNDCAPTMFHGASPEDENLPLGPVVVPAGGTGFGWDAPSPATPLEA